jgi:hypothetical protein
MAACQASPSPCIERFARSAGVLEEAGEERSVRCVQLARRLRSVGWTRASARRGEGVEPGAARPDPLVEDRLLAVGRAARPSPSARAATSTPGIWIERREVREREPEGARLGLDVGVRIEQRVAEDVREARRQLALDVAPGVARRAVELVEQARDRVGAVGSNSIAWFGRGRRNRSRAARRHDLGDLWRRAPRPFEVDIFLPPMLRNSYGTLIGGSRSNTSRAIASERSREPPGRGEVLAAWLDRHPEQRPLRGPFEVPRQLRRAAITARPSRRPAAAGPRSRTLPTLEERPSRRPNFVTIVVPTRPQVGQMTEIGCQTSGCCTLATRGTPPRTVAADRGRS